MNLVGAGIAEGNFSFDEHLRCAMTLNQDRSSRAIGHMEVSCLPAQLQSHLLHHEISIRRVYRARTRAPEAIEECRSSSE
jgi:hypothetical protein